ncbi:MAG: hypothetical protein J5I50_09100 [Chitinophagaceae bacterium]|nr:hypothetical protein [Chitinophagaceae bacterium]
MNTKTLFLSAFCFFLFNIQSEAKIWRVNNTPGVNADFTQLSTAISNNNVKDGDTIYVEGSDIPYQGNFYMSKRLVIIGNGYYLDQNTGLQANIKPSGFGNQVINVDSSASGSQFIGLADFHLAIFQTRSGFGTDSITITRCKIWAMSQSGNYPGSDQVGWKITKCYFYNPATAMSLADWVTKGWDIRNNIFNGAVNISNPLNLDMVIRNNVFRSTVNISEAYFANNIINNSSFTVVNCFLKNNLAIGNPAGFASYVGTNNNQDGFTDEQMFLGPTGNSEDGQWQLKAGSPAIGAGLTVGSVVNPDCGAFGATDPYKLSGIPNIPTIYSITAPDVIPAGTNTMNVTFSTRNNN